MVHSHESAWRLRFTRPYPYCCSLSWPLVGHKAVFGGRSIRMTQSPKRPRSKCRPIGSSYSPMDCPQTLESFHKGWQTSRRRDATLAISRPTTIGSIRHTHTLDRVWFFGQPWNGRRTVLHASSVTFHWPSSTQNWPQDTLTET